MVSHEDLVAYILNKARNEGFASTSEINDQFGFDRTNNTGRPNTRMAIKAAIREYAVPRGICICANSRGYFPVDDEEDLEAYKANLLGRIAGHHERIELAQAAWDNHEKV